MTGCGSSTAARMSRSPIVARRRRRDPAGEIRRDAAHVPQRVDQAADQGIGVVQQEACVRASSLDPPDPLEDVLLRPRREALDVAQPAGLGGRPQPLERVDPELGVQEPHRLRSDAGNAEHVEQAIRDLGAEPLVVLEVTGLAELGQLRGQRRAGAR